MTRSTLTMSAITAASLAALPAYAQEMPGATFVVMEEISAPIVDASRVDGLLRVSLVLQVRDAHGAARLARRMPELRAAGLAAAIELARLHGSPFTAVDANRLTAALTPVLQRVDGRITKVLIVKLSAMPT
ncbi:hypothetical protein [Sphingobium sp. EM0848]|uniref:hypothetical protein n=1 Tax=Sphingobium sp. EM0848 TaxID=2743473 RepID=UPI00159C0D9F|nr:hypothetical protein [Sphingobium sp. EM0848]